MNKLELIELLAKYRQAAERKLNDEVVATAGLVFGNTMDELIKTLCDVSATADSLIREINTAVNSMSVSLGAAKDYYSYGVLVPTRYGSAKEDIMRRLCDGIRRTAAYRTKYAEIGDKFTAAMRKVQSMRNPDKILALATEMGIVVTTLEMPSLSAGVDTVFIKETINKVKELA